MKKNLKNDRGKLSLAMRFILLFGVVSLFSDMTHEGASSIRGAYLSLLGASAGAIGFVSGLGELIGYSMRYLFGRLTDRTGKYWPMTILGYVLDIAAVPALALVGEQGWIAACALLSCSGWARPSKSPRRTRSCPLPPRRRALERASAFRRCSIRSARFWGRCCSTW